MTTKRYDTALMMLRAAKRELEAATEEMQSNCKHPWVYEAPYEECLYAPSSPPFRVCPECGYGEEGWGCGYRALRDSNTVAAERRTAMSFMIGGLYSSAWRGGDPE